MIKEICEEKNISFKTISDDWVMVLKKDNLVKYILSYKFPLNNQVAAAICDDKYALYEAVKDLKLPILKHKIITKYYDKEEVLSFINEHKEVVLKYNNGKGGKDVYRFCSSDALINQIDEMLKTNQNLVLQPYYDILNEYRIIVLDNQAELIFGKENPIVYGNGINTIYELLCEFNGSYFGEIDKCQELDRVLKPGESYEYSWQFNLSKGSKAFLLKDKKLEERLKQFALEITSKLGIRFASVDIALLTDNSLSILEINSSVTLNSKVIVHIDNGYEIVKDIYSKVIDKMFEK